MGRVLSLSIEKDTELIFRIVRRGDNYGKNNQFVWDSSDCLIEVYDSRRNHMIGTYHQSLLLVMKGGFCLQKDTYELSEEQFDIVKKWIQQPDTRSVPMAYHYHFLNEEMIVSGKTKRKAIRVNSKDQAIEQAKKDWLEYPDGTYGCLTVFSDGSIVDDIFDQIDLNF